MATTPSSIRTIRSATTFPMIAKHYIAGLLKYAPEFALHHQSVRELLQAPGFRRGGAHSTFPGRARNRSTLVRIPAYRPNREVACRVELRNPDPAANPYLGIRRACLPQALPALKRSCPCEHPTEGLDLFELSRQDLRKQGVRTLPESLGEAVELFAESELMQEDARRAYPRLSGGDEARRVERIPGHRFRMGAQSLPRGPLDVRSACGKG